MIFFFLDFSTPGEVNFQVHQKKSADCRKKVRFLFSADQDLTDLEWSLGSVAIGFEKATRYNCLLEKEWFS